MAARQVRVLLLADTHLGFDLPRHPRVVRRRRGHDFFENVERALQPAMNRQVDMVVHGGDLFFRSRVPASLVEKALLPLVRVADRGVPVYLVPGNHERSRIPNHLWAAHPAIHIFHEPMTYLCQTQAGAVALVGLPFTRQIRDEFASVLARADDPGAQADLRLLCLHQAVEGAQVGPSGYTFRRGADVVRGSDVSSDFAAVLSGHIHRSQLLTHDLRGRVLGAPVLYPGSVERTSFAERHEAKHYILATFEPQAGGPGTLAKADFVALPARPMVSLDVEVSGHTMESLGVLLRCQLRGLDPESVVRIRPVGAPDGGSPDFMTARWLRSLGPATMNISLSPTRSLTGGRTPRRRSRRTSPSGSQ